MKTQQSRARQALHIYDTEGEEAMLAFAAANQLPADGENQNPAFQGIMVLSDRSAIHVGAYRYRFMWAASRDGRPRSASETRGRTAGTSAMPVPQPAPQPVCEWPNTHSIINEAMKLIERELRPDAEPGDDPLISPEEAIQAIPELYAQARQEAINVRPGDSLLQDLDQINADAGGDLLENLDRHSLEALRIMLRRKAEEEAE